MPGRWARTPEGVNSRAFIICGAGLLAASLLNCGKKAPLRLPGQKPETVVAGFRARVRERQVLLEFKVPARRVFPERETSWIFARILRRDGPQADFKEVGTLLEANGFDFGARLSWADEGREPGIVYSYRVELLKKDSRARAASPAIEVSWNTTVAAPRSLAAVGAEASVLLNWEAPAPSEEAVRYRLYRRLEEERAGEVLSRDLVVERHYLDTGVERNRLYCYRVSAVLVVKDIEIEGSPTPEVCTRTEDLTPPPPPAGLVVTAIGKTFLLTWRPVVADDLRGYIVYRATGDGNFERITPAPVEGTALRDETTDLVPGTTYRYRLNAVDRSARGNEGAFSDTVSATLPPP